MAILLRTLYSHARGCNLAAFWHPFGHRLAAETTAFIKALRNFLRGPTDDDTLRAELTELAATGAISQQQVDPYSVDDSAWVGSNKLATVEHSSTRCICTCICACICTCISAPASLYRPAGRCDHGGDQPADVLPERHVGHAAQGARSCDPRDLSSASTLHALHCNAMQVHGYDCRMRISCGHIRQT